MLELLKRFFAICRLKASPADLPASWLLTGLAVGAYAASGWAAVRLEHPGSRGTAAVAVDTGLLVALAWVALWIRERRPRFAQTLTALAGAGTFFNLLGLPVVAGLQAAGPQGDVLLSLALLGLVVWNIAVFGDILRHALDLPAWAGAGIAVLYVYTSMRVVSALLLASA